MPKRSKKKIVDRLKGLVLCNENLLVQGRVRFVELIVLL
jgi:hypothetical protein